ncbi:hypothetical protein FJ944_05385, partial [Mesorhizobium sp. B2-4-11]
MEGVISPLVGEMAGRPEGGAVPPASRSSARSYSTSTDCTKYRNLPRSAFLRAPPLPCRASPPLGG